MEKKKVCIAFLGNAEFDSRLTNLRESLKKENFEVKIVSFEWQNKNFKPQKGEITSYLLNKQKFSLPFYIKFLYLLAKFLNNSKADIYFAEDIYTLPLTTIFARIRGAKLYYNSRELYAYIGGLRNKRFIQLLIKLIERFFIRKADRVLTTGKMDAQFLEKFYNISNTVVIRNLPSFRKPDGTIDLRRRLNIKDQDLILIYQGVLIGGRGLVNSLKAVAGFPDCHLVILGEGERRSSYQELAAELGILDRVHFLGTVSHTELIGYTAAADIGLAIIENITFSYYYALPNKLFEYIMAGKPVICSNLPQMKEIIDTYGVGVSLVPDDITGIIDVLRKWYHERDEIKRISQNCLLAARELNWEVEFSRFLPLLKSDLSI